MIDGWEGDAQYDEDLKASITLTPVPKVLTDDIKAILHRLPWIAGAILLIAASKRTAKDAKGWGAGIEGTVVGAAEAAAFLFPTANVVMKANAWRDKVKAMKGDRGKKLEVAQDAFVDFAVALGLMVPLLTWGIRCVVPGAVKVNHPKPGRADVPDRP